MNTETLIRNLEEIINSVDLSVIPYQKGNSIRIKNYIIRKNKTGYLVYNCETNSPVTKTNFKSSAIAIVKKLSEGKNCTAPILALDNELLKHYNDAIFYKNFIKNNKNEIVNETRKIRLNLSIEESERIQNRLENFIFD